MSCRLVGDVEGTADVVLAVLTASGDPVELISLDVTAITDDSLPDDDLTRPAQLG